MMDCPECLGLGVLDDRGFQLVGQPFFCTQPCPTCKGEKVLAEEEYERLCRAKPEAAPAAVSVTCHEGHVVFMAKDSSTSAPIETVENCIRVYRREQVRTSVLHVGLLVRVKDAVWREWCLRNQKEYKPFEPQPIISGLHHEPYANHVMLAYPFYWWRCDEVEVVGQ